MSDRTIQISLRPGPLAVEGYEIQQSGLRWLRQDGQVCRPGEIVASCSIGLVRKTGASAAEPPFRDESYDFQVAFAPRVGGRLKRAEETSRGGFLDLLRQFRHWNEDAAIGYLECSPDDIPDGCDLQEAGSLRMLLAAGRRATELAEVRSGLLTGWFDRARAWWDDGLEPGQKFGTLLSMGICEQVGIIRGEEGAFLELFESTTGPAQVVFIPDDVMVPSAAVLASQLRRETADRRALAEDLAGAFGPLLAAHASAATSVGNDWIFAACLLKALLRSPLTDSYDLLTSAGLVQAPPASAVLLSLNSEPAHLLEHKRLGYAFSCHAFRIQQAGPAIAAWVREHFEIVRQTPESVYREYIGLIDELQARTGAHVLIMNAMSSVGFEDVYSYAFFDAPLRNTLSSVRAKEMNLMLHDLARARDISIVDVDAIAARLGGGAHLPDGVHQSGRFQAAVRARIVRILEERGVPGFSMVGVGSSA